MRNAFSLAEILIVVPLLTMVIVTVIALRVGGHRAQVVSGDVERLQAAAHALARHAAEDSFETTGPLPDSWVRDAGADPRELRASVAATSDPDVLLFTAEAVRTRSAVRCRRLVVRADASLARSFPLEARR